jgi:hypothetical protein
MDDDDRDIRQGKCSGGGKASGTGDQFIVRSCFPNQDGLQDAVFAH